MGNKYGYPIADWLDESSYPDPEKLNGPEFAWEYIRRNPEYQKDFETCKNPPSLRYKWNLISKWFREGHGISKMLDPKEDKPRALNLRLKFRPTIIELFAKGRENSIVSPFQFKNDIVVVFNLDQPIRQQTESVDEYLRNEQKKRKIAPSSSKPKLSKHKLFWQIIDAKSQKVPPRKIRKIFKFKYEYDLGVDELKGKLKQALEWRDSNFIKLVNLPKEKPKKGKKKILQ